MVTIDTRKCTACGVCAEICHESCISITGGTAVIAYELCSTCTQCIAVCPRQALSWNRIPPAAFDPRRLPSADQLEELLKQRRTVRQFTTEKIDPGLLEKIVGLGSYAPTHNHEFRSIVVTDESIIDLIDQVLLRFCRTINNLMFKHALIRKLLNALAPAWQPEMRRARPKVEKTLRLGSALLSRPAAIVFIVADARAALSGASAQYVLYNMNLYAMTLGVACRNLVGNQMAFNRSAALRKSLQLGRHERIFGTLGLGYAAVKFSNKVEGRKMNIRWLGDPHRHTVPA